MTTKGRALESAEMALCELYDILYAHGEVAKANEVGRFSRVISRWRNERVEVRG